MPKISASRTGDLPGGGDCGYWLCFSLVRKVQVSILSVLAVAQMFSLLSNLNTGLAVVGLFAWLWKQKHREL